MPVLVVIIDAVTARPSMALLSAASLAVATAVVTLFRLDELLESPLSMRAPARAARSATSWAWVRAAATMPMSTARAIIAISAMMQITNSGRIEPVRGARRRLGMDVTSTRYPTTAGRQLASLIIIDRTFTLMVGPVNF